MDRLGEWQTQIKRGLLELCVLALLERQESYGYEIVTTLSASKLPAAEGTLYPLLRRLRRENLLEAFWRESDAGPPRQYYRLSAVGRDHLVQLRGEWAALAASVETLIQQGDKHD